MHANILLTQCFATVLYMLHMHFTLACLNFAVMGDNFISTFIAVLGLRKVTTDYRENRNMIIRFIV